MKGAKISIFKITAEAWRWFELKATTAPLRGTYIYFFFIVIWNNVRARVFLSEMNKDA